MAGAVQWGGDPVPGADSVTSSPRTLPCDGLTRTAPRAAQTALLRPPPLLSAEHRVHAHTKQL